ncbi:MAG: VOC family protein [Bacteroidota bacterium]
MKIDPIIAVQDVEKSAAWYQQLFGWKSMHGGREFEVLADQDGEICLCLHQWGTHDHPTMENPAFTPGNGLILYVRTENMEGIRARLKAMNYPVEREVQLNPNSHHREFSLIDPNGYYLTISAFHRYGA